MDLLTLKGLRKTANSYFSKELRDRFNAFEDSLSRKNYEIIVKNAIESLPFNLKSFPVPYTMINGDSKHQLAQDYHLFVINGFAPILKKSNAKLRETKFLDLSKMAP